MVCATTPTRRSCRSRKRHESARSFEEARTAASHGEGIRMNESDQQHVAVGTGHGVGASMRRKEDARFLAGTGQFVGDIRLPGMLDVAFVRSPVAHGKLGSIDKPDDAADRVFTMDDLAGVKPIVANTTLPGFKPSEQWPLARDKVRQVGEMIAMCVAATRAEAEDLAARVDVQIDDLPAVVDMVNAR